VIIVEGPDGAGKSTLVSQLCEHFDLKQGERGTTDRSRLYEVTVPDTFNALCQAVEGRQPAKIWDRLYYSELVYADLVGRPVEFNAAQQVHIQTMIEALRCPIILCMPPLGVIRANVANEARSQMKGVRENIDQIYDRYLDLFQGQHLPDHTILYDYTYDAARQRGALQFEAIKDEVEDYLENRKERAW
jgi:hypothetical protein